MPNDDNDVVHKTGGEGIDGNKYFHDGLYKQRLDYQKGDTTTQDLYWGLSFLDKNNIPLSDILYYLNKKEGDQTDHESVIIFRAFGNPHITVDHPHEARIGCGVTSENEPVIKLRGDRIQADIYDVDDTSIRSDNIIKFNGSNSNYGINSLIGTCSNTVIGSGEYKDTFFETLKGDNNEEIYLVSDGAINLKTNCQNPNSIKEITLQADGHFVLKGGGSFYNFDGGFCVKNTNFDKSVIPSSSIFSAFVVKDKNSFDWGRILYFQNANGGRGINIDLSHKVASSTLTTALSAFIETQNSSPKFFTMIGPTVDYFHPETTNRTSLGRSDKKWKEIWCEQSSINTSSDERIKSNIKSIPDNILDAWENVNWIEFQYNDAISEKGESNARVHTGLIAQRVASAFEQANVQVDKYGLYLFDKWNAEEAILDDEGREIKSAIEAGEMYGIRYTEALCMEAAYQRRRASRAEARITELEQRLNSLEEKLVGKD